MTPPAAKTPVRYLSARRSFDQTIEKGTNWNNRIIKMNVVTENNGIDSTNDYSSFRLLGGVTYRITAQIAWAGKSTWEAPSIFGFRLMKYGTTKQIGPRAEAPGRGVLIDPPYAASGFLDVIYTPAEDVGEYCLMTLDDNGAVDSSYSIRADVSTYLNITELTGGGPFAFLSARRKTPQTIFHGWSYEVVNIVNADAEVHSDGISYSPGAGCFTLKGGVTYRITAQLGWEATTPEFYAFGVFNYDTGGQHGPLAEALPQISGGTYNVSGGVLDVIHTPEVDGKYCIRMAPNVKAGPSSKIRADVGTCINIVALASGPAAGMYTQDFLATQLSKDGKIPDGETWGGRVVVMDDIREKCGIGYEDDGRLFLRGGTTYRITAKLSWKSDNDFFAFGLFDSAGGQIGSLAEVVCRCGSSNASGGVLDVIHTPTKDGVYYLKMTKNVYGAGASLLSRSSFMNVIALN